MATTVTAAFNVFYETINLGNDFRDIANRRRDDIVKTLGKDFEVLEAFPSGSIPKFTALKGHADLDVMVALHYGKHIKGKTPLELLESVRSSLAEWRTGGRKNGQAVTLYYKTWPDVDIVPVARVVDSNGNISHYEVPDANTGTWIESRPSIHANNIEAKASKCGSNFRRIIKMVKEWNRTHSKYLQSYHIEVLALNVFNSNLEDTPWHVFKFFEDARPLLDQPLWYDKGYADSYLSKQDRDEIRKRFDTAIDLARTAWYKGVAGGLLLNFGQPDEKSAIEKWKQLFGERFPAYG